MDSTKVMALLDQLDDEMDDLEESLSPLIKTALSETAAKLPLLQKAKTFTLAYLRLNGVKAREHPVFLELTRVKQYFDKIKAAEAPAKDRNLVLDKTAAARFIKAGLSGNDKYDLEKAEREAKERARAHIKFAEISKKLSSQEAVKKPQEEPESSDSESESSSDSESSAEVEKEPTPPPKKKKKKNGGKKSLSGNSSSSGLSEKASKSKASPKEDKKARKAKREKKKAKLQKKQKKTQS